MIKDILAVLGGTIGLILRFVLILVLSMVGVYCLGTVFFYPFFWEGLLRLAGTAGCVLGVILLIRIGREKDDGPVGDDFRP